MPAPTWEALLKTVNTIEASDGKILVAAAWVSGGNANLADVDLRVIHGTCDEIDFSHPVTEDCGTYARDNRGANRSLDDSHLQADWEVIELVDDHVSLAEDPESLRVYLNLFRSGLGRIDGVVRLQVGDMKADQPFSFPEGLKGDGASGRGRRDSAQWIEVDIATLYAEIGSR